MELTFDMLRWPGFRRVHIRREDGSDAYTLQCLPMGPVCLYNEVGERLGSVDHWYNVHLGPDIFIGQADRHRDFQSEWYQIHYYYFWTAEKTAQEDAYRVSIRQGEPIGSIQRVELGIHEHRYILRTDDPKYFLMMIMLSLVIFTRYSRRKTK